MVRQQDEKVKTLEATGQWGKMSDKMWEYEQRKGEMIINSAVQSKQCCRAKHNIDGPFYLKQLAIQQALRHPDFSLLTIACLATAKMSEKALCSLTTQAWPSWAPPPPPPPLLFIYLVTVLFAFGFVPFLFSYFCFVSFSFPFVFSYFLLFCAFVCFCFLLPCLF